jgi:hypothetical protein
MEIVIYVEINQELGEASYHILPLHRFQADHWMAFAIITTGALKDEATRTAEAFVAEYNNKHLQ